DDRSTGALAGDLADRLARLPRRFVGDGTGVDDHRAAEVFGSCQLTDDFALVGVEAAAEGEDFGRSSPVYGGGGARRCGGSLGGVCTVPLRRLGGHLPRKRGRIGDCLAHAKLRSREGAGERSASSISPVKLKAAGPVITMWSSALRHSMWSTPPSSSTSAARS